LSASESQEPVWTLTARWIIPVDGPPLENGTVTIQGEHFLNPLPHGKRKPDIDLGNAAILPGFVNAHTHLDLSGMRGKCPPTPDFTQWLRGVIAHRRSQTPEQVIGDIRIGLEESLGYGTTLLGDIAAQGLSWGLVGESPVRGVVFYELIGLSEDRACEAIKSARSWREWLRNHPFPNTRSGYSPHAPYSVRLSVLSAAGLSGHVYQLPLAVHLAETLAEVELLRDRQGPFVPFLQELNAWDPEGLASSWEDVVTLCAPLLRDAPLLLVHANYWSPPAGVPPNVHVVYCPRTHAAFGHPPHPFREFLARGVRVALGTDSLASNPDLDVLAEARFVHRHYPDVPGPTILHMATLAGAEALGWADQTGSITAGKSADLVVLPLPDVDSPEPYSLILEADTRVRAVLFRGQWTVGPP
jgi:cytosine/adenosine deaminase-related metal-dependent hydrolase